MGTIYRRKNSPKWYGEYTDANGDRQQKSTGTTIKRDAQAILIKWETDANNQRHGLAVSPKTTLESLLCEYIAFTSQNTDKHQNSTERSIRRILDACEFTYPSDIDRVRVETIVRGFLTPHGQPIGLRTQASYLTAIKSFTRWMTNLRHALPRDCLAGVKKPNPERDRKRRRRFLIQDEWIWLSKTEHALIYETAIATGYRASELRALTPNSIKSDHLYLDGKHTKNGREAKQFIGSSLRERLSASLPFDMPEKTAEMLYVDLSEARKAWLKSKPKCKPPGFLEPHHGDTLDFHALRHTCGAWLAIAGVNVKVIQSVMRHSTITLTLDTYGHLLPGQEQDAARQLSVLLTQPSAGEHPAAALKQIRVTYPRHRVDKEKP